MRLTVLDEVTWDGKAVPGERTHALFRALVAAGTRGLSESALVEEIWADDPPGNPSKALQVVVSRARSATSSDAIERTERGYRLGLSPVDVDAWALRPEGLRLASEGSYADALPLLERATPDDDVVVARLRAEAAVRGVPAALETYETYREDLADRLGIDPSPELRALHTELLARDQPVRSGVRFDADELIGRDADAAALRVLVRSHRVVSIVGAGGLGKTRLAHLLGRGAEQPIVHFVELAGVRSPEGVAVEVADRLGVRDSLAGARSFAMRQAGLQSQIVDAVGTAPTLLILDNCEQVVEAVADLVSLLVARTPALTVLTTSRAPLGLAAERVYLLPELSTGDAVKLFRERATAARADVTLDDAEVREVVESLDGLPLAIELAAARVRAMSVAEIMRRLDNRFALLRGGSRDAPERHQTLLAVIDWSWNLLDEDQRVALRRLAVFRDGFALDGAAAVLGYDALDVIEGLAEQSLVVVGGSGSLRYRLLETVREFGRMQLVDAGDDGLAESRLRQWGVALTTYQLDRLYSPDQIEAVDTLRAEEGNLVDLLRRCVDDDDVDSVAALFAVLGLFWTIEGSHLKVVNISDAAEKVLLAEPTPPHLAELLRLGLTISLTNGMIYRGDTEPAALERLKELGPGDGSTQLSSTVRVLLAAAGTGMMSNPMALVDLSEDPDRLTARTASMWTAQAFENAGDLVAARAAARRALELCDDSDGPWMRGVMTGQLASYALHAGDFDEAEGFVLASLPILQALGAYEDHSQGETVLALVALHRGKLTDAERILDDLADDEGAQSIFGGALAIACCRAEILLARGDVSGGLSAYESAIELMRSRRVPGIDIEPDYEPWVVFPQATLVAAAVRYAHPELGRAHRDDLRDKMRLSLAGDGFLDIPVAGSTLFALAVWELEYGDRAAGEELLAYAERFSFSRMLPTMSWEWATSLGTPAAIDDRRAPELRSDALRVVDSLAGP